LPISDENPKKLFENTRRAENMEVVLKIIREDKTELFDKMQDEPGIKELIEILNS